MFGPDVFGVLLNGEFLWDWTDVRLNTFAILTLLSLYLVMGRRSQPDGVETRDTFAAFGMFGFALVL